MLIPLLKLNGPLLPFTAAVLLYQENLLKPHD